MLPDLAEQRTMLLPVPFFHVTGCHSALLPCVAAGTCLVLMRKWNAEEFLELVASERVNSTTMVPSMLWQVIESPDLVNTT